MRSRREFLQQTAFSGIGLSLPRAGERPPAQPGAAAAFLNLHRTPDGVTVETAAGQQRLSATGDEWRGNGLVVSILEVPGALRVRLSAPGAAVKRMHLRWRGRTEACA